MTKHATLGQFLTPSQIDEALRLYHQHGALAAVSQIQSRVIEPNMAVINEKLGQANDARYLAYSIVAAFTQAAAKKGVN